MLNKSTVLLLGGLTACILTLPLMASPVTYTYTGNDFETATGPYTLTDFVSGFFTLASPLADNLAFGAITPASYSFTDQVQTFSSISPPPDVTFEVGTDASGDINKWFIALQNGLDVVSTSSISSDFGETPTSEGLVLGQPGGWVMTGGGTSPVPEPGNLALIGIGLVAIGLVRRKLHQRIQPLA